MRLASLLILPIVFLASKASAHPVSFRGGIGLMPEYTNSRQEIEMNYSLSRKEALGLLAVRADTEDGDATFVIPKFNYLAYRDNEKNSQANVYISLGAGGAEFKDDTDLVGLASVQADYETRRIYTLAHIETIQSSGGSDLNHFRYRAGFAPYVEGYEGIHTWLIGQVDYSPEMSDDWTVTPLVRVFYSNLLLEAGVSLKGDPFFALITHF
jgi:hypothetical protein